MRHPVKDDGQAAGLLVLDVLLELMAGSRAVGEFKHMITLESGISSYESRLAGGEWGTICPLPPVLFGPPPVRLMMGKDRVGQGSISGVSGGSQGGCRGVRGSLCCRRLRFLRTAMHVKLRNLKFASQQFEKVRVLEQFLNDATLIRVLHRLRKGSIQVRGVYVVSMSLGTDCYFWKDSWGPYKQSSMFALKGTQIQMHLTKTCHFSWASLRASRKSQSGPTLGLPEACSALSMDAK
eukprot:scaffold126241_cov19-Tisochrysis_lutea.AAC.1